MIVEDTLEINAPPEIIWPYMVVPEKLMQWYHEIKKFENLGDQGGGVGMQVYIEEQAVGPVMKMDFVVTEWVPDRVITLKKTSQGGPKYYEQSWKVEPSPTGSIFSFWMDLQMPYGFIGNLIEKAGKRMSQATVKDMLAELKDLAETETVKEIL